VTPADAVEVVHRKIATRLTAANVLGAFAVFSYLHLAGAVRPDETITDYPVVGQIGLLTAQLLVLCPLAVVWGHRRFRSATRWIGEGRDATDEEREAILREPWKQALRPLVCWLVAAISWAAMASGVSDSAGEVVRVFDGILIGGITTCVLGFLLIEGAFRPLFTLALAGAPARRPSTIGVRFRLLLAWSAGSGVPLLGLALSAVDGRDDSPAAVALLAGMGVLAGLLAIVAVAHSVAEPLDDVRDALARVRDGDLDVVLPVDDGGEVGEVQAGFNNMVTGLRERARLQDLFGRHVGEEVARRALEQGTGLGGEQREASAVFVDLIGSTAMSEVLPPAEVVATLNDFFDVVVRTVTAEGGWVNKFEGDGALCVFGVPGRQPDHAARALRAARRLNDELQTLRDRHPGLAAGIGASSGTVVAGNVGTEQRYEYTVIGPAVNVAARLTDVAKGRPIKVLAAAEAIERAGSEAQRWHGVGSVAIRGRDVPTSIYEPLTSVTARR
jgi:adenylate cyclase